MTERDAMYRVVLMSPEDNTPRLAFADFLEENGEPELSEFVRVQCLILRLEAVLSKPFENQDHCTDLSANWCGVCGDCCCPHPEDARCDPRCPLHSPDSRHHSDDLLKSTLDALRARERELFSAHGAEWFGPNATMTPPIQAAMEYAGPNWYRVVPDRGFPAHWYGSWEHWVGGECILCDGDGRAHGADRPFEWSADVEYGKCVVCKGSGHIPGACETTAWRDGWEMECGTCGGVKLKFTGPNGLPKCPKCGNSSQNATPHGSPELRRCASCKTVWNPDVCPTCTGSGRVPRPCPQGAVPLTDVTLTTMVDWHVDASLRVVLTGGGVEYICKAAKDGCWLGKEPPVIKHIFVAEWPGLTFHLPSERQT